MTRSTLDNDGSTGTAKMSWSLSRFIARIVAHFARSRQPALSEENTSHSPYSLDIGDYSLGPNEISDFFVQDERGMRLVGPMADAISMLNERANAALGEGFEARKLDDQEERFIFGDMLNIAELNATLEVLIPQLMNDLLENQEDIPSVLSGIWSRAMMVGVLYERHREA